jgi:hypothetical protein
MKLGISSFATFLLNLLILGSATSLVRAAEYPVGASDAVSKDSSAEKAAGSPVEKTAAPSIPQASSVESKTDSDKKVVSEEKVPIEDKKALKLMNVPSKVKPGELVNVEVLAPPNAKCTITVRASGVTRAEDLKDKSAGHDGTVSWTFRVNNNFKGTHLPIKITSSIDGKEDSVTTSVPIAVSAKTKSAGM